MIQVITSDGYAALVINTTKAIRAVQPNSTVYVQLAGNTAFLERTLASIHGWEPALTSTLSTTFHPYSYNPDDSYRHGQKVEEVFEIAARYKLKSVMQGENGAPSVAHQ